MARVVPLAGWIVAGLVLPLVLLDAGRYEGYRPEPPELTTAGAVVAAVAGFVLGPVPRCPRSAPFRDFSSPDRRLCECAAGNRPTCRRNSARASNRCGRRTHQGVGRS